MSWTRGCSQNTQNKHGNGEMTTGNSSGKLFLLRPRGTARIHLLLWGSVATIPGPTASAVFAAPASSVMLTASLVNISRDCKFIKTAEGKIEGRFFRGEKSSLVSPPPCEIAECSTQGKKKKKKDHKLQTVTAAGFRRQRCFFKGCFNIMSTEQRTQPQRPGEGLAGVQ